MAACTVFLAACGGPTTPEAPVPEPGSGEPATTASQPPPQRPEPTDLGGLPDWFQNENAAPTDLTTTIAERLAEEAGVSTSAVALLGSMPVRWNNSGIGCARPGSQTLQVITPGWVVFYDVAGTLKRIHVADNGRWVECDLERPLEGTPVLTR